MRVTGTTIQLIIRGNRFQVLDLFSNELQHCPDSFQVGEYVALALFVKDPLAVYEDLHYGLASWGNSHSGVGTEMPEKLIRHPRGGA